MEDKRGQTEYAWIFSLIIGAVIIFLAVYFSGRYVQTSTFQSNIEIARQFDIVLNPFASIGSVSTMTLSKEVMMPTDMMINFTCNSQGDYENMMLKTAKQKSFSEGVSYKIMNKYIFGEDLHGKNYWIFSKSMNMPWRVDDLIYMVSDDYCFVDPPDSIKSEISELQNSKISLTCSTGDIRVCFGSQKCGINVDYLNGMISKNHEFLLFYGDAMMYAAIFSDNSLYKCTTSRLMKRLSVQADINSKEAGILQGEGCDTNQIGIDLLSLKAAADQNSILKAGFFSDKIRSENPSQCPVY